MTENRIKLTERVKEGWRISAKGYSKIIQEEFKDGVNTFWAKIILSKVPYDGVLKILDVGTGPGFFAILLSQAGHTVSGIDASAEMIACAKENAANVKVNPELWVMDSHNLDFENETFDLIVNRNVVWTLTDPVKAYREWHRVLKSAGRLIVFDGNWSSNIDDRVKSLSDADREEYIKKYGQPPLSYKPDEEEKARGWKRDMPLDNEKRPDWDEKTLSSIGYRNIGSKFILDEVFDEKRELLNRANPMFMLWALK
ncbi:MAG: class I SAM-dependent methyltransferase [Clostridiales bacterium]|jgi:SAM-dependent methyltransferase|nr:class I SAM-dependent methyltransferase [Clostridiales bacterium]